MQLSPQFLEAINGAAFVIYVGVLLFFVKYIVAVWTSGKRRTLRGWYEEVAGAIAIIVLVLGDALIRGPVWFLRHMANDGRDVTSVVAPATIVIIAGATLVIVGGVCIVRQFAPKRCEIIAPMLLALCALVFGIGMAL